MKRIIVLGMLTLTLISSAKEVFYITPKGKKYHSTKSCRTLSRSKKILEISAGSVGERKACKVC